MGQPLIWICRACIHLARYSLAVELVIEQDSLGVETDSPIADVFIIGLVIDVSR